MKQKMGYKIESENPYYREVWKNIIDKKVENIETLSEKRDSTVFLVEYDGKKYILKEFRENRKEHLDQKIKKSILGTEAERIYRKTLNARKRGFFGIPETYLLAREKRDKNHEFLLMEYIQGEELEKDRVEIDKILEGKLFKLLEELHKNGIISGDPNLSNFIVNSKGEVRMIDYSCKINNWLYRRRDRKDLKKHLKTR